MREKERSHTRIGSARMRRAVESERAIKIEEKREWVCSKRMEDRESSERE